MSDEDVGVNPRPIYRTPVPYPSTAPGGESWSEYFKAIRAPKSEVVDVETEPFEVVERGVAVDESTLTATQKRMVKLAREIGMDVRLNSSVVHYFDKIQKTDGKTAMSGDVVKAAHDVTNIFMSGLYPKSLLRFNAAWKGSPQKFSAHISDPVGRWAMDEEISWRETAWLEVGVKSFTAWLQEWKGMMQK